MELISQEPKQFSLQFTGKGGTYFGIVIVNWLLTVITLGLYYPWAKAKQLQYKYGSTVFNNDQFVFHGTGKEMFVGMLKTLLIWFVLIAIVLSFTLIDMQITGIVIMYLLLFAFMPIAIHGSYRYRMSRTTWRGIRFGYRGNKWEFFGQMIKWTLLTFLTLGFYSFWMEIKMRKYVYSNIRVGNASLDYNAKGGTYLLLVFKGYILSIITLGIYSFWWYKELFEFYVNNTTAVNGEEKLAFKSTAKGGEIFILMLVNILILVFTLGIGFAWVEMRSMKYFIENIKITGDLNVDNLVQTEEDYKDAVGEEMADFFDIDFVI